MDKNTLRQLRGLSAEKSSSIPNKTDSSVPVDVSNNHGVSGHNLPRTPVSSAHVNETKSESPQQNLPETKKDETPQNKPLTQTDLAQIVRQARGIGVSSSPIPNMPPPPHEEEIYSFITPDMIDENGYLKMSMEEQKALIDGIYEFFRSGLEPNTSPQNPENSDQ